jgi:hypothetical protein
MKNAEWGLFHSAFFIRDSALGSQRSALYYSTFTSFPLSKSTLPEAGPGLAASHIS